MLHSTAAGVVSPISCFIFSTFSTLYFPFSRGSVFLTYKIASRMSFPEIWNGTWAFSPEADDTWMPGLCRDSGSCLCQLPSLLIHLQHWKALVASLFFPVESVPESRVELSSFPIHLVELIGILPWCDENVVQTLCRDSRISQSNT